MPLKDIVLDTNVLEHADNSLEKRNTASIMLLYSVNSSSVKLCLDWNTKKSFDVAQSIIWTQYLERLNPMMQGYKMLEYLLKNKRIKPVSRNVALNVNKIIIQRIKDPQDKVFVKVVHGSISKVLVSHDFRDFQIAKRKFFKKKLKISIITADQIDLNEL
ncbi:MAG: hypothetical protein IIA45_01995 [Bacteroidetes bacterium]|nr:hypothetical protein [Bacteroidota bacterium]